MTPASCLRDRQFLAYRWSYYVLRPWLILNEWKKAIVWFCQRGWRGYADCDTWSLDDYLLSWLPDALENLQERDIGHPCSETEDSWNAILQKMIDGFKVARQIDALEYDWRNKELEAQLWAQREEALQLFAKHFGDLWD